MTRLARLYGRSARRRVAALLVAILVAGTQSEIALPDSHDGDVATAQLAGSGSDGEQSLEPLDTHGSSPAHAVHVDHCSHAHVFASGDEPEIATAVQTGSDRPVAATPRLSSVATPPLSRPPIA